MSRIIIKNLPKQIKEDRLKKVFSAKCGEITDVQLKFSNDGVFRRFAFIGFKTNENAANAVEHFNNTFLDTSRIQVQVSAELGDSGNKPRAWSKYSKDSSKFADKYKEKDIPVPENKAQKKKEDKAEDLLENDPDFKEFVDVHRSINDKQIWGNDTSKKINKDEVQSSSASEDEEDKECKVENEEKTDAVTDLQYLKSKKVKNERPLEQLVKKPLKIDPSTGFTVKLRHLPYKCKKKDIKDFFSPNKPSSLRLPPRVKGIAYALFKTEKDFKAALNKHRSIINGHRIDVVKYENKCQPKEILNEPKPKRPWEDKKVLDNEEIETVAESGRLFVRNLAYSCTEDDLEAFFKPYGPLSEVNLPIDKFTRQVKGFGFITYLIPEHAVKACAELDGTSFQGRLLHILPSKIKKTYDNEGDGPGSSYKKKLSNEKKASSSSSHNWNSLFLGANAVADVMSEKYNTSKSDILDTEAKGSIAVRVALGETQIVNETREFLINNGVNLDEFSQAASERSKIVIIAKNLPLETSTKELHTLFAKHGVVKSILLPPSGITALIEMEEPSEARAAFRKLAYSKFHHLPLYLEWAPGKVFKENRVVTALPTIKDSNNIETTKQQEAHEETKEEPEPLEDPEENANLFVKNLNFSTNEESLREHFEGIGKVHNVIVMRKKKLKMEDEDLTNLSMGYGFVQYIKAKDASRAIRELQHSKLDGHAVELKISNRATQSVPMNAERKKANVTKQKSSKILVRNVPFEAKKKEVEELFKVFGELRAVRLPKKISGSHRGFAFIEFVSEKDAKRAFEALCHSTHLYGRRLVLEWAEPEDDVDSIRKKTADHFFQGGPNHKKSRKAFVDDADIVKYTKSSKNESDNEQEMDL